MKIPITFLGTSQAIPTAKRNHTAILLSYKDENILVDCGEGTQRQFRKAEINPCKLTKLLITHWHGDHVLGLPGLLQTLALNGYNRKLEIYVPKGTRHFIDLMFQLFVFKGKIDYEVFEKEGKIFENKDFVIEALPMIHGTACLAYSFIEKDKIRIDKKKLEKLKINGKLVGELAKGKDVVWNNKKILAKNLTYSEKGRKISFIFDTAENKNMVEIAKDADLLISEATYTENEAELAKDYKHLTAKQAAETAKKAKVEKLILTHISQRYENREKILLNEARKIFKNTELAEDLMALEI
ncbi:MAG: ribonuclease Z [Candidatus Pacearchaeota archaeon]|nr:ribonuclease Z [Candidatus Pacearchaeota archaeon]